MEEMITHDLNVSKHDQEAALKDLLTDDVDLRPLLILFSSGENIASFLEQISVDLKSELTSIALGSSESIVSADGILSSSLKKNTWILLENIHLAGNWLDTLENSLHRVHSGANSKLILTSKRDYGLPIGLLRSCRIVMLEEAEGFKANLESNLSLCRPVKKGPKEASRVFFLICWLHTVFLERCRYYPIGWTSNYTFSDSDLLLSLQVAEDWILRSASGKNNISPSAIPWKAVISLVGGIYGDKMDKNMDVKILESLIGYLLNPDMFNEKSKINFPTGEGLDILVPKGTNLMDFKKWVMQLPRDSLNVIGFSEDMDTLLNIHKGILNESLIIYRLRVH
jgi:dynein heavy chain 1